ncbi:MAG: permease-like cell division protein FtsX [Bacteroidales bacterium]|nr:permease-like cell division protein FtsX [Bacteroidales bacterium]
MRKKPQHHTISVISSRTTATISVALVLFLLGIVALMGVAGNSLQNDIRQRLGFVVIVNDGATEADINALKQLWRQAPYVASVKYSSAADVLRRWEEMVATDTDGGDGPDDLISLFGVNPFFAEFEVMVKPEYASGDSLARIAAPLREMAGVNEVKVNTDLIDAVSRSVRSMSIIMCIVAAALLLISCVLINNTVRLTVYARRFTIYTMKLVGATAGFIRRPFVRSSILQGCMAGIISSVALAALLYYLDHLEPEVAGAVPWEGACIIFGALIVGGIIICGLASLFAANKYLRLGYNDMFK